MLGNTLLQPFMTIIKFENINNDMDRVECVLKVSFTESIILFSYGGYIYK